MYRMMNVCVHPEYIVCKKKREVLVVTLCMQDVLSNWMRNAIPDFEIC